MPGKMKYGSKKSNGTKRVGKPPKKKKGRKLRKGRMTNGSKSKTKTM